MSVPQATVPALSQPRSKRKRLAILEAATAAFLESGYGAATMDEIATRAKVSKQTIYHHFGSKDVLFAAIVEQRVRRVPGTHRQGGADGGGSG